jgi:Flp pilus assembly protein CpaB
MSRPVAERGRSDNRLPVSSRDRRPALAALALLLVVAGALGAALVVYRSGQRTDVLVAAREIKPGQKVAASDFGTARVSADSGSIVHASAKSAYVGSYAVTDIPAGTLINNQMFQVTRVLPEDGVVVGVTITDGQAPAGSISTGSVVRAYYVPKTSSSDAQPTAGTVLANAARVVGAHASQTNNNTQTVSLLVSPDEAAQLVSASASGSVALAVLPLGTKPDIDFEKKAS